MISREEVLKVLEYDEFTGIFTWRVSRQRVKVGAEAGCVIVDRNRKPRRQICVNGRNYSAHRLAWLIMTGDFPENEIDHIDGQGLNNSAANLRIVTNAENEILSREDVLKVLDYDEFTGLFTRKVVRPHATRFNVGDEVGCIAFSKGVKPYRHIQINGRTYSAHRLAWIVLTGNFPEDQIDHIDGNGLNNAAANLRAVSRSENAKNQRKHVTNTSGCTGVYWDKAASKWSVRIVVDGKQKHLGRFDNFEAAVAVRKEAEQKHGYNPNHGSTRPL